MLTNNKAVYGTDGTLKTLKDMGGCNPGPGPTPEPIVLNSEDTPVVDGLEEYALNEYVEKTALSILDYYEVFGHGIYSSAAQKIGAGVTSLLNEGINKAGVVLSLFTAGAVFDIKTISWSAFITIFKKSNASESNPKLIFHLPDKNGEVHPIYIYSDGLVDDQYTVRYTAPTGDYSTVVIYLTIEVLKEVT